MTVYELIQLLEKHPSDLSPGQFAFVKIALNTGKHPWEGSHGDLSGLTRSAPDGAEVVIALVLRRVYN